jgi:hypothetical protein
MMMVVVTVTASGRARDPETRPERTDEHAQRHQEPAADSLYEGDSGHRSPFWSSLSFPDWASDLIGYIDAESG